MNKIKILLEDDNEILGNGYGHPSYRQYLPTKRYVDLLNKYNIKATFYIDMAHYLFLKSNKTYDDFEFQAETIEQTIRLLLKNNMDVQIHLHSQWVGAEIKDGKVYVTKKWNIGLLSKQEQVALFNNAFRALFDIIEHFNSTPKLNSYKAGSWGLQPFENLSEIFKEKGVSLIMGPIKGLRVDKLRIDYRSLHSDYFPYYASAKDINKVGEKGDVIVLPMTPTYLNWIDLIRYMFEIKFIKKFKNSFHIDIDKMPKRIKELKLLAGKDRLDLDFKPFKTHLKINAQKYWYLKKTFKRAYSYIKNSNSEYKIIVIETHTKDFLNTFEEVEKFFEHLSKAYADLEFVTASDIVNDINTSKLQPLNG